MKLYHQTTFAAATSIAKHGIKIDCSKTWQGRGGCIYLSSILPAVKKPEKTFLVNVDYLDVTKVSEWEYICWEDISNNRIIVICDGKFNDDSPCYSPSKKDGFCGHHHPDTRHYRPWKSEVLAQQEARG